VTGRKSRKGVDRVRAGCYIETTERDTNAGGTNPQAGRRRATSPSRSRQTDRVQSSAEAPRPGAPSRETWGARTGTDPPPPAAVPHGADTGRTWPLRGTGATRTCHRPRMERGSLADQADPGHRGGPTRRGVRIPPRWPSLPSRAGARQQQKGGPEVKNSSFTRAFRWRCAGRRAGLRRSLKAAAVKAERLAGRAEERGQDRQAARYRANRPTNWDVI
jgi:hypothetical protein